MDGGDLPQDENARSGPTLPGPSGEKGVPLVDLSPEAMVRAGGRNPPETGTKKWEELEKTMNTLLERIKCAVCFEAYGTAPPPFHYCINEHFLCFGCYEVNMRKNAKMRLCKKIRCRREITASVWLSNVPCVDKRVRCANVFSLSRLIISKF